MNKQGGRPFASSSNNGFQTMIADSGMIDLGFVGYSFKWNNKRQVMPTFKIIWTGVWSMGSGELFSQKL